MKISELPQLPDEAVDPITVAVAGGTTYQAAYGGGGGGGGDNLIEEITLSADSSSVIFQNLTLDFYRFTGIFTRSGNQYIAISINESTFDNAYTRSAVAITNGSISGATTKSREGPFGYGAFPCHFEGYVKRFNSNSFVVYTDGVAIAGGTIREQRTWHLCSFASLSTFSFTALTGTLKAGSTFKLFSGEA